MQPVDTSTSIATKCALMRVSQQFHNLSCRYLFENLYFHDTDTIKFSNLRMLLTRRLPDGMVKMDSYVKNLYISIDEDTPTTDDWTDSVTDILQQLSALRGFFLIFNSTRRQAAFWNTRMPKMAKAVPSCISHFEWICSSSWIRTDIIFPTREIRDLFCHAKGLCAIRLSTTLFSLPLGDDITLPELKYLDINVWYHTMDWPKFSSLTHIAFKGYSRKPIQLPGGTLPMLSFLYIAHHSLPTSAGSARDMLATMPNLRTLLCFRSFPIPR